MSGHDKTRSPSTYAEIVERIRSDLASGLLAPGDRLPSVRVAADEWGVHRHTVERAYQELSAAGIVESKGPHGTVVCGLDCRENYQWNRRWRVRGESAVGDHGDANSQADLGQEPPELNDLRDSRCIVLLGEAGGGKSTAIRRSASDQNGERRTATFDLGEYGSESSLSAGVFDSPTIRAWRDGTDELELFLDGFDEGRLNVATLAAALVRELAALPRHRLFLRIVCRTAVWPESLGVELLRLWSEHGVTIAQLEPLSDDDVRIAADAEEVDADVFMQAIRRHHLYGLAARPASLIFLLRAFKQTGHLPPSLVETYRAGLTRLCSESAIARFERGHAKRLSPEQLLAVAQRIAAAAVLTNRPAIRHVPGGTSDDDELTIDEIAGGAIDLGGAEIAVDARAVAEALDTGLFVSRGSGRLGFAHRSFAEFLAALWLFTFVRDREQIGSLLMVHDPTGPRVAPQLQETAGWLATMDKQFAGQLLEREPELLLLSDTGSFDDASRRLIVESLLQGIRKHRFTWSEQRGMQRHYGRLQHEALESQLHPIVLERTEPAAARIAAISIATECALNGLAPAVAEVALDASADRQLRIHAAYALLRIGDAAVHARLKGLVLADPTTEPDDMLKGCSLRLTWPDHLTAHELFRALTPKKQRNLHDAYSAFLRDPATVGAVARDDIPLALEWAAGHDCMGLRTDEIGAFCGWIISHAWDHADAPGVLEPLARAVWHRARHNHRILDVAPAPGESVWMRKDDDLAQRKVAADDTRRRRVVEAVLAGLDESADDGSLFWGSTPLVYPRDLLWAIDRSYALTGTTQARMVRLANGLLFHGLVETRSPNETDRVIAARSDPGRPQGLFQNLRTEMVLDDPGVRKIRADFEKWKRRANRTKRPRPGPDTARAVLVSWLDAADSGVVTAWIVVDRVVTYCASLEGPATDRAGGDKRTCDATVWLQANTALRDRILAAARTFVEGCCPYLGTAMREPSTTLQFDSYYRALEVLFDQDTDYLEGRDSGWWAAWAPLIALFPGPASTKRSHALHGLASLAYQRAPDSVRNWIARLLEARKDGDSGMGSLEKFDVCLDDAMRDQLLAAVRKGHMSPSALRDVATFLHRNGVAGTTAALQVHVTQPPPIAARARSISLAAAASLLALDPRTAWQLVWPAVLSDADWGRSLFEALSYRFTHESAPLLDRLLDDQLVDLVRWLFVQYEPKSDPVHDDVYTPTADDDIRIFRGMALRRLVDRGTEAAINGLRGLRDDHPEYGWLLDAALDGESARRRRLWRPPGPRDLLTLVRNASRRLVLSEEHLLDVVAASVRRFERKLHGETPLRANLWNTNGTAGSSPKNEEHLSDNLKAHLEADLVERAIVVGREVQIRRKTHAEGAPGERVDLLVQATKPDGGRDDLIKVVVEVKRSDNRDLRTAMQRQLAERYLEENQCRTGLYIVGWFDCDAWQPARGARNNDFANIRECSAWMDGEAEHLCRVDEPSRTIRSVVIDCTLR